MQYLEKYLDICIFQKTQESVRNTISQTSIFEARPPSLDKVFNVYVEQFVIVILDVQRKNRVVFRM